MISRLAGFDGARTVLREPARFLAGEAWVNVGCEHYRPQGPSG
ncbi:hypothetical protein [Streptomyces abyssomicinicus]|nr:hypothetical protein [Streptomyces abyssomicinicus]